MCTRFDVFYLFSRNFDRLFEYDPLDTFRARRRSQRAFTKSLDLNYSAY